ncbi:MAG: lytic transglycosylase domain-containing protein [Desulfobacteraceae bacterium]|nr:lytic transglycosylase domain-containing protein [Desulfobacteraceae bacterium]
MGIHFDNPIDKLGLHPASGSFQGRESMHRSTEPESFLRLLSKASESVKPNLTRQDQATSSLEARQALELCQRVKLQMNENLLSLMSDTKEEKNDEISLMEGLKEILPGHKKKQPLLSKTRQDPSEIEQPEIQMPELEKNERISGDRSVGHTIDGIIQKASSHYGVDSDLIRRVIEAESNFKPDAVSSKGAMGLMQLMPGTARELGVTDPLDPSENIMAGTRYLKKLINRYDGSVPHALAAYNWGMGNLESRRSRMPEETKNYVAKITGIAFS